MSDLYLETLNTEILIESIELIFSNIDMNDSLDVLLEDGNINKDNKQGNLLMKAIDTVITKIKEIIEWVRSKLFHKDDGKTVGFLKECQKEIKDLSVHFQKSPIKACENYTKIYDIISKNYDKTSRNDTDNYMEEVEKILSEDLPEADVSSTDCVKLFQKYNDLMNKYNDLAKKLRSYINVMYDKGVFAGRERKALSTISKILNRMRSDMNPLAPSKVVNNNGIKSKIKNWIRDNPVKARRIRNIAISIGILTVVGLGAANDNKKVKDVNERYNRNVESYEKQGIHPTSGLKKTSGNALTGRKLEADFASDTGVKITNIYRTKGLFEI